MKIAYAIAAFFFLSLCVAPTLAQSSSSTSDEASDVRAEGAQYARQLSSSAPFARQTAAEGLARLADVEQKKMVEGYLLQEKEKRVRLALNWALYRMGKAETLFQVVRDLDSGRHDQALEYLTQLDSPDPLYLFLIQDNTPLKVKLHIVEVLGDLGNAETVEKIKPFVDHYDPGVSAAAKTALAQIEHRLADSKTEGQTRPRVVTKAREP